MKSASEGDVMAFRPGPICDSSDDESEDSDDDGADGALQFWLGVVVAKWLVAEEELEVCKAKVLSADPYIVVQWLEVDFDVDTGDHLRYVLSKTRDCITGVRIEGILPVKKLRKVTIPRTKPGQVEKKTSYGLHSTSRDQILCLL